MESIKPARTTVIDSHNGRFGIRWMRPVLVCVRASVGVDAVNYSVSVIRENGCASYGSSCGG